ncbi:MAG: DUF1501 domain-containing protein [Verrucomicrobiales bacterium]
MSPVDISSALAHTRRAFLRRGLAGLGALALSDMVGPRSGARTLVSGGNLLEPKLSALTARAKRVIYLHMEGSPPQHDLLDYKPELNKRHMQPCPKEFFEGKILAFTKGHPNLLASPYKFRQCGRSGVWLSELFEHFPQVVDEVAIIKSMFTDQFNHAPAQLLLQTGTQFFGGASMGSWVTYGLGTENQNLPGFVVLISGPSDPSAGKSVWGSGFLPSVYQGVQCRSVGEPILYVNNPPGMSRATRRATLDALRKLNEYELETVGDPETLTRINQFELAYRMQMSVPEVMDITKEPAHVLESYGATPGQMSLANNCLLARRLVEQGVRFVQLFDWGWDIHGTGSGDDLITALPKKMKEMDRPVTALLKDLRQRGLLDETLVIWGGEFGRTSMNEARDGSKFLGRDHHPGCFTIWMAGGGVKPGITYGSTDELGYNVAENKVHVHDLQATILHLLGIDAERLSFPFQGLNQRLIGPQSGWKVQRELLA